MASKNPEHLLNIRNKHGQASYWNYLDQVGRRMLPNASDTMTFFQMFAFEFAQNFA